MTLLPWLFSMLQAGLARLIGRGAAVPQLRGVLALPGLPQGCASAWSAATRSGSKGRRIEPLGRGSPWPRRHGPRPHRGTTPRPPGARPRALAPLGSRRSGSLTATMPLAFDPGLSPSVRCPHPARAGNGGTAGRGGLPAGPRDSPLGKARRRRGQDNHRGPDRTVLRDFGGPGRRPRLFPAPGPVGPRASPSRSSPTPAARPRPSARRPTSAPRKRHSSAARRSTPRSSRAAANSASTSGGSRNAATCSTRSSTTSTARNTNSRPSSGT